MVDRTRVGKLTGAGTWLLWVLLALIISAILAVLATFGHRTSIEDDLTTRSQAALRAAGLSGLQVAFEGRDGTVRGANPGDRARAAAVVGAVEGVRVVNVPMTATAPGGSPTPASPIPASPAPVSPAPQAAGGQALQAQIDQLLTGAPITFGADSAQLMPSAIATIDQVAVLLSGAPQVTVEVVGHAARTPGDPQQAQRLSRQRADTVAQRLVEQGVAADRVQPIGYGDTRPLSDLPASRRVDIVVR